MSVLEGALIGAIVLFFLGVVFYALGDLFRDRKFYKDRLKNVQKMSDYQSEKKEKKEKKAAPKMPAKGKGKMVKSGHSDKIKKK